MKDDLISRQAVIDALKEWYDGMIVSSFRGIEKRIKALPSVQPEIIRCKDCLYHGQNKWGGSKETENTYCFYHMISGMHDHDYCSKAERKEN